MVRVRFYHERRHSGIGYRTPAQAHTELLFKAAAFPGKLAPNLTKPLRVHRK
jgi:hypothetical protein